MLALWRNRRALPTQCIAAAALPVLEHCAGFAKQSAASSKASKASPAKVAAGEERIEGKTQKLLKVRRDLTPQESSSHVAVRCRNARLKP